LKNYSEAAAGTIFPWFSLSTRNCPDENYYITLFNMLVYLGRKLFVTGPIDVAALPGTTDAEKHNVMKILKSNSKKLLGVAFLIVAALLQNCKKETANTSAPTPKQGMYAAINDTAWTAVTVEASLEYDGFSTGRVFTCRGTMGDKIIQLVAMQNNVGPGNNFPLGLANGESTIFGYYIQPIHRNLTEQNPTAGTVDGTSLVITAIDTGKRLISGTFKFPQADTAYDAFGNVTAVTKNQIDKGIFKQVHYVYTP